MRESPEAIRGPRRNLLDDEEIGEQSLVRRGRFPPELCGVVDGLVIRGAGRVEGIGLEVATQPLRVALSRARLLELLDVVCKQVIDVALEPRLPCSPPSARRRRA